MFREMRRDRQQLSQAAAEEILKKNTGGTLALAGDEGYPYAVPMSYLYEDGKLYFHSAKTGHKIDAIRNEEKASFCVIDRDQVVPEKYTTFFRSVIAFGKARLVEEEEEKRRIAEMLAMKYSSAFKEGIAAEIDGAIRHMAIIEMTVEHMTGKEALELVRERE